MEERRAFLKRTGMVLLGAAAAGMVSPGLGLAGDKQPKPAMIIDVNRCTGCHSCVIACKEQSHTPVGYSNTRIAKTEMGSYPRSWATYTPDNCHHCQDAPCVAACGYEATFALESGIVVTDWSRCTGDGSCVSACPYGARFQDENNGNKVDKCDFCITRLEQGLLPACVENCPSGARIFGDLAQPQGEFGAYLERINAVPAGSGSQPSERLFHTNASKS